MDLRLVTAWCLVSAVVGSTLQEPYIHDLPEDQLAVASVGSPSRVAAPGSFRVAAPDSFRVAAPDSFRVGPVDRTPAARVPPTPLADDTIVLDGLPEEESARPGLLAAPASPGTPWLGSAPTVLVLQPIIVPVTVATQRDGSGTPGQGLEYYGAAAALRDTQQGGYYGAAVTRRRQPLTLNELLRRLYV